jgi:hypothetical protein
MDRLAGRFFFQVRLDRKHQQAPTAADLQRMIASPRALRYNQPLPE